MNSHWQRQRQPDDVPTPVAVAVSDYCRRAKAPATPTEVREALALLSEADDFRVRTLTDTEPAATPLGPFAVVDVLKGTEPSLAALRQGCGYYDVVQELARVHEEKQPLPPPPAPEVPEFATPAPRAAVPAPVPARPEKAPRTPGETVQQRIAPRKRTAPDLAPPESDFDEAEAPSFLKRDLPKPRGRFTRLDAPKTSYQELTRSSGKETLEAALESHEHRFALLQSLSQQYNGSRGELTLMELEGVLRAHGLMEAMEDRERTAILSAFTEHRGASGRVGWALGLSPSELRQLEAKVGMSREVEEVRERFRREALTARNLTQRLDLLGREKYLVDLGIKKRFTDMLRRELEVLVRDELPGAKTLSELADVVARKQGAPSELVLRALERLGVAEGLHKRTPDSSPHSTP
ncbi:hypothetical protein [Archangium sp.]|uniref:hypothetical protein n=1 Tax=Archangium sp. TaxID=1872627 RepID=UPI002D54CF3F|nr:hypothetical protein [Archangium sp.]HYO54110.1 hypothetical protein [Archangium sp.]